MGLENASHMHPECFYKACMMHIEGHLEGMQRESGKHIELVLLFFGGGCF